MVLPAAVLGLPALLLASSADGRIARLDAIAEWTRNLSGVLTAGQGLEQAMQASLRSTPEAIRPEVARLVARLRSRWPTEQALRAFADDLDDATGDLVAAALILGSRKRGDGLAAVLTGLAESVADDVRARRQIEADRAKPRATARRVTMLSVGALTVLRPRGQFLAPYATPLGPGDPARPAQLLRGCCCGGCGGWPRPAGHPHPRQPTARTGGPAMTTLQLWMLAGVLVGAGARHLRLVAVAGPTRPGRRPRPTLLPDVRRTSVAASRSRDVAAWSTARAVGDAAPTARLWRNAPTPGPGGAAASRCTCSTARSSSSSASPRSPSRCCLAIFSWTLPMPITVPVGGDPAGMFAGWFLPDGNVRRRQKARAEFRRALGSYIDLVALERHGGGSGTRQAMENAAEVGDAGPSTGSATNSPAPASPATPPGTPSTTSPTNSA